MINSKNSFRVFVYYGDKMKHDLLSDAFVAIQNAEKVGKKICSLQRSSLIKNVLQVMERFEYIKKFTIEKRSIDVELLGKINKARSVRPRFAIKVDEFEKYEKRYLPSKDVGILIISTSAGVISHKETKEKKIGGRILGYVY